MPVLSDPDFKFADIDNKGQQGGGAAYRIPLGNGEVAGVKGKGTLDGKEFTTLTFKKVLIPIRSGDIVLKQSTVSCTALVGYQRQRDDFGSGSFNDFFNDDFFNRRTGVYNTVVVPSNSLSLKVLDLPERGRPSDFAGHVGKYTISASAVPVSLSVGDPITLTLTVSGPDYLENVQMPALDKQSSLTKDFKIPSESAGGQVSGKTKIFTQTIRPLRTDVKEIPAIELPYFDTDSQSYQTASTKPIPITVKKANVITAMDAEGSAGQVARGNEVETLNKGIASNYDDPSVIRNVSLEPVSQLRASAWKWIIIGPPLVYLLLLTGTTLSRLRNGDAIKISSKKVYSQFLAGLRDARNCSSASDGCAMLQDSLRNYLADKLNLSGKTAMTFNDIKEKLSGTALSKETLNELEDLFKKCEAGRYAGMTGTDDIGTIADQAELLAKEIEKTGARLTRLR